MERSNYFYDRWLTSHHDFVQFLPGANFVGGVFEDLSTWTKNCRVATNPPHLKNAGDDPKFVWLKVFLASADKPLDYVMVMLFCYVMLLC